MGAALSAKVLVLGLDGAGKTSLGQYMEVGPNQNDTQPSTAFNTSDKKHKGVAFTMYDVSGAKKSRDLWKHYYEDTEGLIWMVDSSDADRFKESKDALVKALKDAKMARDIPVLVLVNKKDKKKATPQSEVEAALDLDNTLDGHTFFICSTDVKSGEGVGDGLDWLAGQVKALLKARKKK